MDHQPPKTAKPTCWVVTDGAVGNEKQCLALTHYLALKPMVFRAGLRWPWRALAPRGLWAANLAVTGHLSDRLAPPWPSVLIGCGRRAALVSRWVRSRSDGYTRTVQILNPRIDPAQFDHVICPRHDGLTGQNVIRTEGALHRVDGETLAGFRESWVALGELPSPRVAVLVGASNRAYRLDGGGLEKLLEAAAAMAGEGSLLISSSRRTPAALNAHMRQWFGQRRGMLWTGGPDSENPYEGFLAWADRFVVSADSVNMISEALGTGQPVHSSPPTNGNRRFARFHRHLVSSGRLLGLDDTQPHTDYPPLRETAGVADRLRLALDL